MAIHSSILSWRIPWTEEPGGLKSMRSRRVLKDPDDGKDWGQEEKGMTEDEMIGWHHWYNGRGFGWTLGIDDGQGCLVYHGSWSCKESDTTERLNWTELTLGFFISSFSSCFRCRVRLFIWLFSCFLRYACIAMNFSLSTVFTVSTWPAFRKNPARLDQPEAPLPPAVSS